MSAVQAARWSGYFRRTTDSWERRAPQLRCLLDESLAAPVTGGVVAKWLTHLTWDDAGLSGSQALARGLRQLRQLVIVALMERDARGAADLDEVCMAMSAFADLAVQAAVSACDAELTERHGAPLDTAGRPQPMLVVGMGKLGAHELNVSSDIDLVYVARDQGMTVGNSEVRNAIAATD